MAGQSIGPFTYDAVDGQSVTIVGDYYVNGVMVPASCTINGVPGYTTIVAGGTYNVVLFLPGSVINYTNSGCIDLINSTAKDAYYQFQMTLTNGGGASGYPGDVATYSVDGVAQNQLNFQIRLGCESLRVVRIWSVSLIPVRMGRRITSALSNRLGVFSLRVVSWLGIRLSSICRILRGIRFRGLIGWRIPVVEH